MSLISIVDNEPAVCRAIESLLKSLGYTAACFSSAKEYLKSHLKLDTACLILDVHMPDMDGIELKARLLADGDCIPTIFMSAAADDATEKRAIQMGAVGIVSKPIRSSSLTALVKRALAQP
jgi:FixJ family two-component response regulator